jgi:hypothetical protein
MWNYNSEHFLYSLFYMEALLWQFLIWKIAWFQQERCVRRNKVILFIVTHRDEQIQATFIGCQFLATYLVHKGKQEDARTQNFQLHNRC